MTDPIETKLKWYSATQSEVDRLVIKGEWRYSDIILCTSCENASFCFSLKDFNPTCHRGQLAKIEWPGEDTAPINTKLINDHPDFCLKLLLDKISYLEHKISKQDWSIELMRSNFAFTTDNLNKRVNYLSKVVTNKEVT